MHGQSMMLLSLHTLISSSLRYADRAFLIQSNRIIGEAGDMLKLAVQSLDDCLARLKISATAFPDRASLPPCKVALSTRPHSWP